VGSGGTLGRVYLAGNGISRLSFLFLSSYDPSVVRLRGEEAVEEEQDHRGRYNSKNERRPDLGNEGVYSAL